MNYINNDFMNFSELPRGLCNTLVSLFEVCLQLLHLLTHASNFLLDMLLWAIDIIDLKITIWAQSELYLCVYS